MAGCPHPRNNVVEVAHVKVPTDHGQFQYLTISEQVKEHLLNDNDGKTMDDVRAMVNSF